MEVNNAIIITACVVGFIIIGWLFNISLSKIFKLILNSILGGILKNEPVKISDINISYKLFWCINRNAYRSKCCNISICGLFWNPGSLTIISSKIILKILSKIVYFLRNLI